MTNKFTLPKGAEWYNKSKGIYIERLTDRTPEWHKKREDGIGGSECGNVLGLNDNPGGSVGYWVTSNKFITKNNINTHIQKIKTDINCPF